MAGNTRKNGKDAQLLLRIRKDEREEFVQLCEMLDTSAAREIRHFIRGFIDDHRKPGNQQANSV